MQTNTATTIKPAPKRPLASATGKQAKQTLKPKRKTNGAAVGAKPRVTKTGLTRKTNGAAVGQSSTTAETGPSRKTNGAAVGQPEKQCFMEAWAARMDLDELKKNHRKFRRICRELAKEHNGKLAIMYKQQVVQICNDDDEAAAYVAKHLADKTYCIEEITSQDFGFGAYCILGDMFVDVELSFYAILNLRANNGKQEFYLDDTIGNHTLCVFSDDLKQEAESYVGGDGVYVWGYSFSPANNKPRFIKFIVTSIVKHEEGKTNNLILSDIFGFNKSPISKKTNAEILRDLQGSNKGLHSNKTNAGILPDMCGSDKGERRARTCAEILRDIYGGNKGPCSNKTGAEIVREVCDREW